VAADSAKPGDSNAKFEGEAGEIGRGGVERH
jgi:hypothetical protein